MVNFKRNLPFPGVTISSDEIDSLVGYEGELSDDSSNSVGRNQLSPEPPLVVPSTNQSRHVSRHLKAPKSPRPENFTKNNPRGSRQKRRVENDKFLLMMATDCEDLDEICIDDFVSKSTTPFTQLFTADDKMKAWNDFASRSGEEQDRILKRMDEDRYRNNVERKSKQQQQQHGNSEEPASNPPTDEKPDISRTDNRVCHPAFASRPQICFNRIEVKLRSSLKRKHLPIGAVEFIEIGVRSWFSRRPVEMYTRSLPSSFDRLLMHAVCQYMDLICYSQNVKGCRHTFAVNMNHGLVLPALPLYKYLQRHS